MIRLSPEKQAAAIAAATAAAAAAAAGLGYGWVKMRSTMPKEKMMKEF